GSKTAALLAQAGVEVVVLEEHREVGRPLHCAGLVSLRTLDHLTDAEVLEEIRGVRVYPPDGEALEIIAPEPRAVVIDRVACDRTLASMAAGAGAEMRLGIRVKEVKIGEEGVRLFTSQEEINARLVIGADGVRSIVRRSLGAPQPQELLPAASAEVQRPEDWGKGLVDLYIGRKVAPGFFAWAVPAGDVLRVGVATTPDTSPRKYLKRLIEAHHWRSITIHGGAIPIGRLKRLHGERALLVGDAAGHVKPLSGGGLLLGQLCARHCARHALDALRSGDLSVRGLGGYTRACEEEYGKERRRALMMRKVFTSLTDEEMRKAVELLRSPGVLDVIAAEGDIDFPSKLVKPVLARAPKLMRFSPQLLKALL
ncbi:MAG: NAD(P)/FAD-dependent oxidoreductase, partial [Candidatus Thermoplasmatota archaeon]